MLSKVYFSQPLNYYSGLLNAKKTIDQSSNPILDRLRSAFTPSERVESEEAKVVRAFRMVDPRFSLDAWMRTATEFYIPDGTCKPCSYALTFLVIDAITRGDLASLKPWASESVRRPFVADEFRCTHKPAPSYPPTPLNPCASTPRFWTSARWSCCHRVCWTMTSR